MKDKQFMVSSLFADIPHSFPEEIVNSLVEGQRFRVERIVSRGHASPPDFWYDQNEHEWVLVLSGSGVLRFEGCEEVVDLSAGDYINIPAHQKHRVESTDSNEPTIWLAIFYS